MMKLILIALAGASVGLLLGRNWPAQASPVEPASVSPQAMVSPPSVVLPQGQMAAIPDSHNERVTATNAIECIPSLRALGCPDGLLAQLVRFAFRQAHQAEYCELEAPLDYMIDKPSQLLARQQMRIQLEKGEENALKESGLPRSGANGNALFSPQQMQKIIEAKELYPGLQAHPVNPEDQEQALANQQARYRHVSSVLSPEEMVYYTLAEEGGALSIEKLLKPIHPSPEEFLAVAKAAATLDCNRHNGQLPQETDEKLKATLSPERYSLLQELSAPEYRAVEFFADMMKISNQQREQLIELRRGYKSLGATAYRAQVGEILKQEPLIQDYLQHPLIHPNR